MSLSVRGLGLRYPRSSAWTLRGVDLDLADGETLLLLGPSGSGKSSVGLALAGLIPASIPAKLEGEISYAGVPDSAMSVAERTAQLGIVFQDPESQFCLLTVEDEVAFGLENLAVPRNQMAARVTEALDLVDLADKRHARLERLSGGQKQRLALACALARYPKMLFLDEPTANLDPAARAEFYQLLAGLRRQRPQLSMILVEHVLDDLIDLVDRVAILAPGDDGASIRWQGPPREVFAQHAGELDALGVWVPQVTALALELRVAGITLHTLPLTVDDATVLLAPKLVDGLLPTPALDVALNAEPLMQVRGLSFAYGDSHPVLRDLSLDVPDGAFMALVGPNGSGKSTLSALLAGIRTPPPGLVMFDGHDLSTLSIADLTADIGYVFQNPEHQFLEQRVDAEVAYSMRVRGRDADEIERIVAQLLHEFGLLERRDANPFKLSQGQKRRLSVATMLTLGQRLLILDEPTFGQDRNTATALMARLSALHAQGVTILMITHDQQLVADCATHVACMQNGRVIRQCSADELFADDDLLHRAALRPPALHELAACVGVRTTDGFAPRRLRDWLPAFGVVVD